MPATSPRPTPQGADLRLPNFGPPGYIHNGKIDHQRSPARQHTSKTLSDVSKLDKLLQVGIVYSHANATDLPARAIPVDAKFDGIVSAGVGNGNLYHTLFDTPGQGEPGRHSRGAFRPRADRLHHPGCGRSMMPGVRLRRRRDPQPAEGAGAADARP